MNWTEPQLKWMEENAQVLETGSIKEVKKAAQGSIRLNSAGVDKIILALSVLKGLPIVITTEGWYSTGNGMAGKPDYYRTIFLIEGLEIKNLETTKEKPVSGDWAYDLFKAYISCILEDSEFENRVLRLTSCRGYGR